MTYDPTDIANGLIRNVSATDVSPIARLTRLLDGITDDLMAADWKNGDAAAAQVQRGEARGLAAALSIITCYSDEEVREQIMLRYDDRHSMPTTTEETSDDRPADASARTGRRKRKPSRA